MSSRKTNMLKAKLILREDKPGSVGRALMIVMDCSRRTYDLYQNTFEFMVMSGTYPDDLVTAKLSLDSCIDIYLKK